MENAIINVDSRLRDKIKYPNEANFIYNLNNNYKNIVSLTLSSFEFPNTSYVFSSTKKNNTFTIIYSGSEYQFTIDDGNYIAEKVIDKINDYFTTYLSTLTITLNKNNGKVTFTSSGSNFTILFANIDNYQSFGQLLGFKNTTYTSTSLSVSGENMINVIGEHYYFLKLNDFGNVYHNGKIYMSKLVITSQKFELTYEDSTFYVSKKLEFVQPINLTRLEVEIVDYNGNTLVQNGIDLSFSLEIKMVKNTLLKKYKELSFNSSEFTKQLVYDKLLVYLNSELEKKGIETESLYKSVYKKLLKEKY